MKNKEQLIYKASIFMVLLSTCINVHAIENKFPVSDIPVEMRTNRYAVIREKVTEFKIIDKNRSSYRYYMVVTIFSDKGKEYASESVQYDKLRKITKLEGTVYDAAGKEIEKLKTKDIIDHSNISGFSLYEDNRVKFFDMAKPTYPYTVEIEYQVDYKFLYSIPPFYLYHDDEVPIQKTVYSLSYPKNLKPKYRSSGIENEVSSSIGPDGNEILTWSFQNIIPTRFESYSPNYTEVIPNVIAVPIDFSYDGYDGKMDTWENIGKWQVKLNQGRAELPETTKAKIKELVKGLNSQEEKIKAVYEYLQNKTRYVSIQLGIGGFQPFEAKVVDELGYGDCKALSNYMVALLKEANITAYYTQIYAGYDNRPVPKDFAIDYFNHIIVTVPTEKDTLWLECTNQTNPFGYLGKFTGDRYALMITETEGKLIKTRSYSADENLQSRSAEVNVDLSGNATARIVTTYSGIQYENDGLDNILSDQFDSQKRWVQNNTSIPNFDINSFKFTNHKDIIPTAKVELDLSLQRLASVSGKRIFLTPNLMNKSSFIPEKLDTRKYDIVQKYNYMDIDTIHFHLPENIAPEFIPETIKFKSQFGEYQASFSLDQGSLVYVRKIKLYKGRFPKDSYKEFQQFFTDLKKADNTKIVFLNKT